MLETIPYPSHPALKHLFHTPIWLWRLGLGPLVGRLFMVMTTTRRNPNRQAERACPGLVKRRVTWLLWGICLVWVVT